MNQVYLLLAATVLSTLLSACAVPASPDVKVIVGATLIRHGGEPLPHSVIVIRENRIAAIGSQQIVPIPPGSSKIEAYGKYVAAADAGRALQTGSEADLVIYSGDDELNSGRARVERRMKAGRWIE